MSPAVFAIRDDLGPATRRAAHRWGARRVDAAARAFVADLAAAFGDALAVDVAVVDHSAQSTRFSDVAADLRRSGLRVVSGDVWARGDVTVGVSRRFCAGGDQMAAEGLVARPGAPTIGAQTAALRAAVGPAEGWVWVDDDVVTGGTAAGVAAMVGSAPVATVSLLDLVLDGPVIDVVDARDFLVGADHGGLVVGEGTALGRVPYHHRGVDLWSRASVPTGRQDEFRRAVTAANVRFAATACAV